MPDLACADGARARPQESEHTETVPVVLVDGPCTGEVRLLPPYRTTLTVERLIVHTGELTAASGPDWSVFESRTERTTYWINEYAYCLHERAALPPETTETFRVGFSVRRPEPDEVLWFVCLGLAWTGRLAWDQLPECPAGPDDGEPIAEHPAFISAPFLGHRVQYTRHENALYTGSCTCTWVAGPASLRNLGRLARMCLDHERRSPLGRLLPTPDQTAERRAAAAPPRLGHLDTPESGSTCAHVCGADPDHVCDARASTYLEHKNLAGGTRRLPLCGPCHHSETAAIAAARYAPAETPVPGGDS